jgi:hypothetical protein
MPSNEVHRLIDIIAFGHDYRWLHTAKDHPSQYLGHRHRRERHYSDEEWLGKLEGLGNRPRDEEVRQSNKGHDLIDLTWSSLSTEEKLGWAAAFRNVALYPKHYSNLFMPEDYNRILKSEYFRKLQRKFAELSLEYLAGL